MFCHIWLSDYFSFRSLQNSSNGKNFNNDDDIESYLIQFFANKNHKFYERGIMIAAWKMAKGHWSKWATRYGIKLFSSMKKLSFSKKNPQLLSCQPNIGQKEGEENKNFERDI